MISEIFTFEVQVILAFITAFSICYFLIPPITRLARDNGFVASPDKRSSHKIPTPTIGGVAIYLGFIISTLIFAGIKNEPFLPYMTASSMIIFMVGLKDDIYTISPKMKLLGQMSAILIVVLFADIRITNFQGVFGIFEIPYWVSILFSIFIFVAITNAVNLMDGIDGLAASMGIVSCIGFGIYFWTLQKFGATILCGAMIGSLIAFLRFNYALPEKKIFMGDTGSLIIGFIVAGVAIRFNEINLTAPEHLKIHASPIFSVAILAIPIFDTLRVMIFRILRKKSPFRPDKSHIHHVLLTKGYTHHQATILISAFSFILIFVMYEIQYIFSGNMMLVTLFVLVALFYMFPFTYLFQRIRTIILNRINSTKLK